MFESLKEITATLLTIVFVSTIAFIFMTVIEKTESKKTVVRNVAVVILIILFFIVMYFVT